MKVRIVATPGHPEVEALCRRLIESGVPDDARLIYRARNRVYSLTLPTEGEVNIKAFKIPRGLNPWIYTFVKKSKAERSYLNSLRLISLGFGAPEPLAYAEERDCAGRLRRSFFVSRQLTGIDDMRQWQLKPDSEPLLRALAAEMLRLHRAGVWHKDFSPGNILYSRRPDGGYDFSFIDLNRMEFGVSSRPKLMSMFAAVNIESEEETRRLGRYYGQAAGIDPDAAAAAAGAELASYLRRKRLLHALKRPFKRPKK